MGASGQAGTVSAVPELRRSADAGVWCERETIATVPGPEPGSPYHDIFEITTGFPDRFKSCSLPSRKSS